jgi:hypothetical protein
MKKANDNGGNFNPTQWSGTDANGNPLFYNFGVSIGGGGVNAIGFGLNSGSPTPNAFINMQPNLSTPGINFSYDDVSRFEPSYDFPAMRDINPDYFYKKNAQQSNGGPGDKKKSVLGATRPMTEQEKANLVQGGTGPVPGIGKIVKAATNAKKIVVIDENMLERVIPYAKKYGFKYFKPTGTNPANFMKNQTQWIRRQIKDPNVTIIDIGRDIGRNASKYYDQELKILKKYFE